MSVEILTEAPFQTVVPVAADPVFAATRPLRVLAVDDDPLVIMNTVPIMEDLGHSVIEAHSADEELAILEWETDIDLIVTDHSTRKMTGASSPPRWQFKA